MHMREVNDIEILENVICPLKQDLIAAIEKNATYDGKSNVDTRLAKTRIYSPHKYNSQEFFPYIDWLETLNLSDKRCEDSQVWGLTYTGGDYTRPHDHGHYRIAGIHYLVADEGCGVLQLDGSIIEPKEDMIVLSPGYLKHGVLPAENPEARRICVVFNLR